MKKNKPKYIVIIILVCIAIGTVWYFSSKKEQSETNEIETANEDQNTESYNLRLRNIKSRYFKSFNF